MPGNSGTQVITRVCRILRSFDRANPEQSLAELARKNNLHPTTAYRILHALVEEGLLMQDSESTKYSLGYGLVKIGELAKQGNALLKMVQPYAEKLAKISGESITIEVLKQNLRVDTLLFIPSSYRITEQPPHGTIPANCTATGKVQLAYLPSDQLEIVLDSKLEALTVNTITDPVCLKAELVRIRNQGYAIAQEELEIGFVAVAAPIFDINGNILAGISVGGPTTRMTNEQIPETVASVVEIARAVSKELGCKEYDNPNKGEK
jgi:DNA-binding IclR family transcriptional regulator